jgi:hypothetical protein
MSTMMPSILGTRLMSDRSSVTFRRDVPHRRVRDAAREPP